MMAEELCNMNCEVVELQNAVAGEMKVRLMDSDHLAPGLLALTGAVEPGCCHWGKVWHFLKQLLLAVIPDGGVSGNLKLLPLLRQSHFVALVGLELTIFLLQPPKCWSYRPVPPSLVKLIFQEIERLTVRR